jgi:serine/threonine protein kinase
MVGTSLTDTGIALQTALADLGRYRTICVVGEGGMGRVHLAEEIGTGRRVAVKVLRRELMGQPELVAQFLRTVEAVRALEHPNLAGVIESGTLLDGRPYLVMEYLQGRDLRTLLGETPAFDCPRAIDLSRQLCAGLAALHGAGIVHLDLKPSNVLIARGLDGSEVAKVLDFGIAVKEMTPPSALRPPLLQTGPRSRVTWLPLGAPEYWSPEQAMGRPVDGRSDVYALGTMMYELLTGATPFGSHTLSELIEQHVHLAPRPLVQPPGLPVIPEELKAIVLRCLAKDPEKRFQRAEDVDAALAEVPAPTAIAPEATPPRSFPRARPDAPTGEFPVVTPPRPWRRRLLLGLVVLGGSALAVGLGLTLGRVRPAPPRPPAAAAAAPAAQVTVSLSSQPPGAAVHLVEGGALLGRTPATAALPRGDRAVGLLFRFPGGQERRTSFVPDRASQVHVQASPAAANSATE